MEWPGKPDDLNATRRSLLEKLKDWEDQESWMLCFNTYWRLIYSVALRAGLTEVESEEVVQETFVVFAKKIKSGEFKYDPSKGKFRNWLIHTTQFRVLDQLRKRKHQAPPQPDTETQGTNLIEKVPDEKSLELDKLCEEEWENNLFLLAVERAKPKVSARHFQIFDLYVIKKWPAAKVAETVGVSRAQVHLIKHRVAKLVKEEVNILRTQGF